VNYSILEKIQQLSIELKNIIKYILSTPNIIDLDFSKILKVNDKIHNFKISFEKKFALLGEFLVPALKDVELELAKIYLMPAITQEDKKARMILWILKQESWLDILSQTLNTFLDAINKDK
ncbi:hypothetical protein CAMP5060_08020, partial [Campylobacter sp. 1569]|nr:hypothetical protein [Campylobacter sp. 1569]